MEASRAQPAPAATPAAALPAPGIRQLAGDLIEPTKPKVQSLLLLTTVTTMLVAGSPSIELIVATCIGGYLSAGGAGAVNHWYDRDIDGQMARTATRPIPAGRIAPRAALWFGITLGVAGFFWLWWTSNLLAGALSFSGFLGYTLMYTMWLKRRTWQNIVWGGAAGAVPPLVGWGGGTRGPTAASHL